MAYNSPHVLFPFPPSIVPPGAPQSAALLRGIGGTISGSRAAAYHPVAISPGADCPTCNLVEIPYNPNLPVLRL